MHSDEVGRFFVNWSKVTGLYSYRIHGNMRFSAHKEGKINRKNFHSHFLDPDSKIVLARVNHGTSVIVIRSNKFISREKVVEADALVTKDFVKLYLAVTFADCPPIFLFDPKKKILAAIHGGWKPVMNGIIYDVFNKMIRLGAKPQRMQVAILPGIGRECFQFSKHEAQKIFRIYKSFVKYSKKDKCRVDLKGIIRYQLICELGIKEENLEVLSDCTCCRIDRYFSYRGEKMTPENIQAGIALLGMV